MVDLQSYEYDQTVHGIGEKIISKMKMQAKHSQDCKDWSEERKKIAGKNKGKFWITNGTDNKMR